jgi:hypothetical protein
MTMMYEATPTTVMARMRMVGRPKWVTLVRDVPTLFMDMA